MNLSDQQSSALSTICAWLKMRYQPFFYLAGYAGTGKTFLALEAAKQANCRVVFMAFTGKAASVMRQRGCRGAATIHSNIYFPEHDNETGERRWKKYVKHLKSEYDLIILDECSMVDEQVGADLLSAKLPILVLGDPAQLPPVKGTGFFTNKEPDFLLTEIQRQESGGLIDRLATAIRAGKTEFTPYTSNEVMIVRKGDFDASILADFDITLCGRNQTRADLNQKIRELKGISSRGPVVGEQLIGLRNSKDHDVINGENYTVTSAEENPVKLNRHQCFKIDATPGSRDKSLFVPSVLFDGASVEDATRDIKKHLLHNFAFMTFGHAITVHKSQGSQWDRLLVFDESWCFREDRSRWLYTAVTRAAKHITLVI